MVDSDDPQRKSNGGVSQQWTITDELNSVVIRW